MKYKIYADKHLLVDVLEGNIELSDLESIVLHEISNTDFRFVDKILSNISKAQLNVSASETQKFASYLASSGSNSSFRWAILTDNPKQAALSFLIQENEFFNNIVGVFSTLEACNQFLNSSLDINCFNEEDYITLD